MGMCSGSAGGSSSGGTASEGAGGGTGTAVTPSPIDAAPVAPPTCTTILSYPGRCQAKVTTCTADADCPSPWTCQGTYATTPVVASPVAIDGGPAVPVPPPADFAPVTKTCQPPATYTGVTRGDTESKAAGDAGATITLSSPDAGAATGATKPPTPTPPGATNSGPTETVASTSGGGCSVSAGQGAVGSAWLVLAALALLVARRGRRRAG
jgi:MYXO-CTERM domain-containing protein